MIHPVILKPNIGGNGLLNGLVSAWEFNETSGSTAYDSHGSNDGTISGATVDQTGKIDKAYRFTSTDNTRVEDDFVEVPDSDDFSLVDGSNNEVAYSIEMWVYFLSFNSYSVGEWLISKRDKSGNLEWQLFIYNDNFKWQIIDSDIDYIQSLISNPFSTNVWHQIVVTYDGNGIASGIKVYLDNSLLSTTNNEGGTYTGTWNTNTPLIIGSGMYPTNARGLNGYIDCVRMWKGRELNSNDISLLNNNGNGLPYSQFTS